MPVASACWQGQLCPCCSLPLCMPESFSCLVQDGKSASDGKQGRQHPTYQGQGCEHQQVQLLLRIQQQGIKSPQAPCGTASLTVVASCWSLSPADGVGELFSQRGVSYSQKQRSAIRFHKAQDQASSSCCFKRPFVILLCCKHAWMTAVGVPQL